jgi:hypothetical protein
MCFLLLRLNDAFAHKLYTQIDLLAQPQEFF